MINRSSFKYLILSRKHGSDAYKDFSRTHDEPGAYGSKDYAEGRAETLARNDPTKEFAVVQVLTITAYNQPVPVVSGIEVVEA